MAVLIGAGCGDFEGKYPTSIPVQKILFKQSRRRKNSRTFSEPRKRRNPNLTVTPSPRTRSTDYPYGSLYGPPHGKCDRPGRYSFWRKLCHCRSLHICHFCMKNREASEICAFFPSAILFGPLSRGGLVPALTLPLSPHIRFVFLGHPWF